VTALVKYQKLFSWRTGQELWRSRSVAF